MEGTPIMKVAAHLRLKRSQGGLSIPTGKDLHPCLQSALVVARYFLQELGLSPEIARMQYGDWSENLYITGLPTSTRQDGSPSLAIDDLYLFPYDARNNHWCIVPPIWVNIPDQLPQPESEMVLPMYLATDFRKDASRRQPLYEALLTAVQMHIMDNLRRDLLGVTKDYLEEYLQPGSDNLTVEYTRLVLPAMRVLLHNLPCLKSDGHEKIQTTVGRDWVNVENPYVRFSWTHASGIWRVWYRERITWYEIDPLVQTPPPAAQLLARRDFTAVFHRAVPAILARKIKEVELPLVLNKTWSTAPQPGD